MINSAVEKAKALKPSEREELEITDLNKVYMEEGSLKLVDIVEEIEIQKAREEIAATN